MCIILMALEFHPQYKLVFAANRDEFHERPSAQAHFWPDAPRILAGRDRKDGGTWSGITTEGRIGALTNYRDPSARLSGAPSRGHLVPGFLLGAEAPGDHLASVIQRAGVYNGFNLLAGRISSMYWTSNRTREIRRLSPGIHGVSNRLLDTPWPKVVRGREKMAEMLSSAEGPSVEGLMALLADRVVPPDTALPDTGMGLEWERILSPIFVESPTYGTRSSTVVLVDRKDRVTFVERTHDAMPAGTRDVRVSFTVEP